MYSPASRPTCVIAVDGKVYAKLPTPGYTAADPADYGAPDPAA